MTDDDNETMDLSLDKIMVLIRDAGFPAYVEQTGGGTATLFVGEPVKVPMFSDGQLFHVYPVLIGPGWFEGPHWTDGKVSSAEWTCIGPDESYPGAENLETVYLTRGVTEMGVAAQAIAMLRKTTDN